MTKEKKDAKKNRYENERSRRVQKSGSMNHCRYILWNSISIRVYIAPAIKKKNSKECKGLQFSLNVVNLDGQLVDVRVLLDESVLEVDGVNQRLPHLLVQLHASVLQRG